MIFPDVAKCSFVVMTKQNTRISFSKKAAKFVSGTTSDLFDFLRSSVLVIRLDLASKVLDNNYRGEKSKLE